MHAQGLLPLGQDTCSDGHIARRKRICTKKSAARGGRRDGGRVGNEEDVLCDPYGGRKRDVAARRVGRAGWLGYHKVMA